MGKEKSSENNPKKKSKLFKIIGIVILSLILIVTITAYFLLKTPADKGAYIQTFEGEVQVFTNNNWQTPVLNQELSLNDKIKTTSGSATLLLMEKAIVSIEPNTEIEISSLSENNIQIKQNSGSTWNKFLGIVGVDTYSVETPNAVASVRGTEFNIKNNTATVSEGVVGYKTENDEITLNKYEKAEIKEGLKLEKQELTKEEKSQILERKKETLKNLKNLRNSEIEKNKFLVNKVKDMYKLTDDDINMYLEKIDNGEIDDNMLIEKSPVKTDSLKKVKKINDEIKNTKKDIATLEKELNPNN